ncbi:MAG TPA: PepSY domain-containing protein [Terriglobales bacterium]|nr:PepSY domain-containing protein [Terriglobales bacterium]
MTWLATLLVLLSAKAIADPLPDHEEARRAYAAGEIVSLASILSQVERSFDAQVIEVELEHERGRWIYEVELLTKTNKVIELVYDAKKAELLENDGPVDEIRRKNENSGGGR